MNRRIKAQAGNFTTREAGDGRRFIEGYFAVFGSQYELWDGAYETIAPTAFDGALEADIRCLTDHNTRLVLGRTTAKTLTLQVDEKGLWGSVEINQDDQDALNLYARVQRGDVSQCSFGFDILEEDTEQLPDGGIHWIIRRVKLYEVSIVTFPAYEETSVTARKKDFEVITHRRIEAWRQRMKARLKGEDGSGTESPDD